MLRRILIIAQAEIRAFVQTKAFLMSVMLMPLLMLGASVANRRLQNVDARPRTFAVLDGTGVLFDVIEAAAIQRDRAIAAGDAAADAGAERFVPTRGAREGESLDDARLRLSDAIRSGELFAFVELPRELTAMEPHAGGDVTITYVSDSPAYLNLRGWLEKILAKEVRRQRYRALGLEASSVDALERAWSLESRGPWRRGAAGDAEAAPVDKLRDVVVPVAASLLLFMLVMISTPYLLQAVIEEKASRISEVLLGSVSPFELMMGKLLASVAVSLGLGAVYVTGALRVAAGMGYAGLVSPRMVAFFFLFLILAMFIYGSIYLAVGAACSELKEAQSLLMPVVLLVIVPPFFLFRVILESPSGALSTGASLVPTATPFLMLLRVGLHPTPPAWQVALSVVTTLGAAVICVWAAGRVFRVGLLAQGKAPSLVQLARWVVAGK